MVSGRGIACRFWVVKRKNRYTGDFDCERKLDLGALLPVVEIWEFGWVMEITNKKFICLYNK